MRWCILFFLFSAGWAGAQDTITYKDVISEAEGSSAKVKYYSGVTGTKQTLFLRKGKWLFKDATGQVVKEVNYKVNKGSKKTFRNGALIYLDPEVGDTILMIEYKKGRIVNQLALKSAILQDDNYIYHCYQDFDTYSVTTYRIESNGPNFTSIWQSSLANPEKIIDEEYLAFEDSIGDPSLLEEARYGPKSRYNYVQNPEFESHPGTIMSIMSFTNQIAHWAVASKSPDYFLLPEAAHSGSAFAGFRVFTMVKDIEYIQNPLKFKLEEDSVYCFSAYLKLSPGSKYATNSFGFLLSSEKQYINTDDRLTTEPSKSLSNQILNFKSQWMKVQCPYTAAGGEKWLTMGSFQNHKELELLEVPGTQEESYYYLDDVSLVPVKNEGECPCNFADTRMEKESVITEVVEPRFTQLEVGKKIILDDIHFENDKSVLLPASYPVLLDVLVLLKDRPSMQIKIGGHTSSLGGLDHNLKLSARRAKAVKNFLTVNGISQERIQTDGYGPAFPIADDATEEGQLKNRRVEFEVLNL